MCVLRHSVVIRRLSDSTNLVDCNSDLWKMLNLTKADIRGESNKWHRRPSIQDFNFDIWQLNYMKTVIYGKSIWEVVAEYNKLIRTLNSII